MTILFKRWSEELAQYAELNTRRCEYGHDCHSTPEMKKSGQNIYETFVSGSNFQEITDVIDGGINSWWSEHVNASQSQIENCCGPKNTWHFLVMANHKSNQVGCAISQFTNDFKTSYMVCNYSYTNVSGTKVYEAGSPASKCETGSDSNYSSLCSKNEPVNVNQ